MKYLHDKDFKPVKRGGKLVERYRNQPAPCFFGDDKCPKVKPFSGIELTEAHWKTYTHYLECKATGQFPDDAIVKRNAAAIARAEQRFERKQQYEQMMAMAGKGV